MPNLPMAFDSRGYTRIAVEGLASAGWILAGIPESGRAEMNRQLIALQLPNAELRFRLSIYKIGGTGRGRAHERRVEITTTYKSGLRRHAKFRDVVLGYEVGRGMFVGLDPRRLDYGGDTHNASSFVSQQALTWQRHDRLLIRSHPSNIFSGMEYHAFFYPECLGEYLLNIDSIHAGTYNPSLPSSPPTRRRAVSASLRQTDGVVVFENESVQRTASLVPNDLVAAFERGDDKLLQRRHLTPEMLAMILEACEENGQIGEQFVVNFERERLRRAGRADLADKVEWVSQDSVSEGFDIRSFENDAALRLIEVKSTVAPRPYMRITRTEWDVATTRSANYMICAVVDVRNAPRIALSIRDPVAQVAKGTFTLVPHGWELELTAAKRQTMRTAS